jgi:hypothetical protein
MPPPLFLIFSIVGLNGLGPSRRFVWVAPCTFIGFSVEEERNESTEACSGSCACDNCFRPCAVAREPNTGPGSARSGDNPLYKVTVNVLERSTKVINYRHQRFNEDRVSTDRTFPRGLCAAKVESKQGYIEIEAEFDSKAPRVSVRSIFPV